MSHIRATGRSAATVAPALILSVVLLAACGSSSSPTTAASTAAANAAKQNAPGAGFTAFRECLQRNGVKLPNQSSAKKGAPSTPGAGLAGGDAGPQLPAGVSRATYEAAIKKCGGVPEGASRPAHAEPRLVTALASFAACMRRNGVNVPAPNTSGKGPVFNSSGLNPTSPKFTAARTKCQPLLRAGFKALPGTPGTAPPPAGG